KLSRNIRSASGVGVLKESGASGPTFGTIRKNKERDLSRTPGFASLLPHSFLYSALDRPYTNFSRVMPGIVFSISPFFVSQATLVILGITMLTERRKVPIARSRLAKISLMSMAYVLLKARSSNGRDTLKLMKSW